MQSAVRTKGSKGAGPGMPSTSASTI